MRYVARQLMKAGCGVYGCLLVLASAPASAATSIADVPLFLTVAVPPNIILTLDDSGSMRRAFVPENCLADTSDCDHLDNRYEKSAKRNLIYYDPTETYEAPRDANGNQLTTSFTKAWVNGYDQALGWVDLSTNYRPTAYLDMRNKNWAHEYMGHYSSDVRCSSGRCQYRKDGNWQNTSTSCSSSSFCRGDHPNDPVGIPAYYYTFDASNSNCNGTATDNDCYDIVFVSSTSGPGGTDERQNFANWYSFARTRNLAAMTAAALAFNDLDEDARVAWQGLNSCRQNSTQLNTTSCSGWRDNFDVNNAIDRFGNQKADFYTWLFQQPTDGGTPLPEAMARAGEYYKTSVPYRDDPTDASSNVTTCRKNYHILFTDGIWTTAASTGDVDGNDQNIPDPTVPDYDADASYAELYEDNTSNTLADVAFKYWVTDLRTGMENNVPPSIRDPSDPTPLLRYWNPRNDPATWQHMVNFTIGLGLTGYLNQTTLTWNGDMYGGSFNALKSGAVEWPAPSTSTNDPDNVADLWHAALNSRGKFFSADNPSSLAAAFKAALLEIDSASGSSAALSSNSTSINPGSQIYQAKFNSDWSGTLIALPVAVDGTVGAQLWDAALLTPAHTARNIYTHNGTAGVEFKQCSALSTEQQTALDTNLSGIDDNRCQDRLDWLRGDGSKEIRAGGSFRSRPMNGTKRLVMGDIINSDPAYVKAVNYGYGNATGPVPGKLLYDSYVSSMEANRPPMVYVGANDGKLYGIDAETGVERFAYVPAGSFQYLSHLTDPAYSHRYYVDGSITVGDAFDGVAWKTILVAGLNAGGKSIYALDVTDPANFNETNIMWEFTHPDLGYTFSQPQIGVLESGQWVAVFGNGYNSPNGGAELFVVDLFTGTLLQKITARDEDDGDPNNGNTDESNGLSTPVLYDSDDDGLIDTAYAGDLHGNLWRFDLSTAQGTWRVPYTGGAPVQPLPVFTATDDSNTPQHITAQPKVAEHPDGGLLVFFGTGRYLAATDVNDFSVQTFYGILDDDEPAGTRANLQEQTIDVQDEFLSRDVRITSMNSVDWATQKGWYLDLLVSSLGPRGERVVSTPLLKQNRAIFVTVAPSTDPCDPGGTSWLMEVDLLTGGGPTECVLDLDGDGVFNEADERFNGTLCPSGLELTVGISKTPVWLDPGDQDGDGQPDGPAVKLLTGTLGTIESVAQPAPAGTPPSATGSISRRSWIQIR